MTRYFTWSEFDKSVDHIANECKRLKLSGIYGVPRGGLCLAVALRSRCITITNTDVNTIAKTANITFGNIFF